MFGDHRSAYNIHAHCACETVKGKQIIWTLTHIIAGTISSSRIWILMCCKLLYYYIDFSDHIIRHKNACSYHHFFLFLMCLVPDDYSCILTNGWCATTYHHHRCYILTSKTRQKFCFFPDFLWYLFRSFSFASPFIHSLQFLWFFVCWLVVCVVCAVTHISSLYNVYTHKNISYT